MDRALVTVTAMKEGRHKQPPATRATSAGGKSEEVLVSGKILGHFSRKRNNDFATSKVTSENAKFSPARTLRPRRV